MKIKKKIRVEFLICVMMIVYDGDTDNVEEGVVVTGDDLTPGVMVDTR